MNAAFELKDLAIDFKLGEFNLFKARFPMLSSNLHFTRPETAALAHPFQEISAQHGAVTGAEADSRSAGYFFSSYPTTEQLPKLSMRSGRICYVPYQYRRFVTDLTGSFEDYEKKFSGKTRANLKKKVRKFAEFSGGEIQWSVARTPDEMREFYRHARTISATTYQEKLLDAGIPETEAFQREMLELAAQGRARGYLLSHQGTPVSYVYCPIEDGVVVYLCVGYDPKFREHSPGTVLQYLLLESLFKEGGHRLFDYTEGEGPHKELFSTGSVPCADLYFFKATPRNGALIGLQYLLGTTSAGIVKFLKRLGLHKRVKELIRFGRA